MKRPQNGRGLFYMRDSAGRHEMTPAEYVGWAARRAEELGVRFDGTPESISAMIRDGSCMCGDLFLDYGVPGNVLSRNGLDAMMKRTFQDPQVSHILIPRRDRLARPDNPLDGVKLENVLRASGITLVFMNQTLPPLAKGKRQDPAELILAVLDYDRSGRDRRDLAEKIIFAHIHLAKMGFSTGGRPRYGFRRWLVSEDGTPIRQLEDGECVRQSGRHVVWLPGPDEEIGVIRRILDMLETMPASRVAATLTAEGISSPDAGRCRTDNGVTHPVSGIWHQTTIVNIARNPLLVALCTHGARSMGDQLRHSPDGPRELDEADYRPDEKPKVIRNPQDSWIVAPARFEPIVQREQHQKLLSVLDARAGTQRGKPRSQNPSQNPLGCRVFDMNCTWPMYRTPYKNSFRYKCGLYQQSHGERCAHNHIDGPTATRFVLSSIRQRLLSPTLLPKLTDRLRKLAEKDVGTRQSSRELKEKEAALSRIKKELEKISRNLALAETPKQYKAIAGVFEELKQRQTALEAEITAAKPIRSRARDHESEIRAAITLAERLTELAAATDRFDMAGEIAGLTNARLFLRFSPAKLKKRTVNKLVSGVVTFGAAPPPVSVYTGPTGRKSIRGSAAKVAAEPTDSGWEGKLLGNVSRGDKTAIELFLKGVAAWDAALVATVAALRG